MLKNVFFKIKINGANAGKLKFELFKNTPITSKNFLQLCTGEKGKSPNGDYDLSFKNSKFHRVINGFMA